MTIYKAPLRDYRFVMTELFDVGELAKLPGYEEATPDLFESVLEEGAKLCEEVLLPLNRSGDEEGCTFENGVVRTPKGFKAAYKAYSEAGWGGLGAPTQFGGSGLPMVVTMAVGEMAQSANQAFAMYPGLTGAAYSALGVTG